MTFSWLLRVFRHRPVRPVVDRPLPVRWGHNRYAVENVRVIDGDSFVADVVDADLKTALLAQRIRLARVDCWELMQPHGLAAKLFTEDALQDGLGVAVEIHGREKYGRMLAEVFLADGSNLNDALIEGGHVKPGPCKIEME